jgi:hypothetical protein
MMSSENRFASRIRSGTGFFGIMLKHLPRNKLRRPPRLRRIFPPRVIRDESPTKGLAGGLPASMSWTALPNRRSAFSEL